MESSNHLFQKPKYSLSDGSWSDDFLKVASSSPSLTWDPAALLSYVSFGYVCGDKTLVKEVRRQPWLSDCGGNEVHLSDVPQHGFRKQSSREIADEMIRQLENEAELACRGKDNVYVLTSGGLDSRIVAGIVKRLKDQHRIKGNVHSVTWGRTGSRDVAIGKAVADSLGFQWTHLDLTSSHFYENLTNATTELAALVSPIHLHRMVWFRSLPAGDIVLAGSYGDSVGRAEFSGRTVLELLPFQFSNSFDLLKANVAAAGQEAIQAEMKRYRQRFSDRPEYAIRECEQQCHYMRGMIAQTMSVIANECSVYQMFTDPKLFGYVWSVHPSFRTDEPYAMILEQLGYNLESLPWARTNRTLSGVAGIKIDSSVKEYHDYGGWMADYLNQIGIESHVNWLESTGLFNGNSIVNLANLLQNSQSSGLRQRASGLLAWTFSLKRFADRINVNLPVLKLSTVTEHNASAPVSAARRYLREIPLVLAMARKARKWRKRREAIRKFPPQ